VVFVSHTVKYIPALWFLYPTVWNREIVKRFGKMREEFGILWRCLLVLFDAGFSKKGNSRHVKNGFIR